MEQTGTREQARTVMEKWATAKARERARVGRWDLNIAIFLFTILILVIILLFQNVGLEIVAPVSIFGLSMVWLVGWRRGNQLFKQYYDEELGRLQMATQRDSTMDETIEEKVQKAFRERFNK